MNHPSRLGGGSRARSKRMPLQRRALIGISLLATASVLPARAAASFLEQTCAEFSPYDLDRDGTAEISSIRPLPDADPVGAGAARGGKKVKPLVLVLVQADLLQPLPAGAGPAPDLRPVLDGYLRDLRFSGWRAAAVSTRLYAGKRHQDGRIILALRRFLQKIRKHDPRFAGTVLVGHFPDAFLVRTYNWRRKTPLVLNRGKPYEKKFEKPVPYLRTVPEPVATRCDLILGDLDGRWERCYVEPREHLSSVIAAFPGGVPARGGISRDFEIGSVAFEDFFYVNDGHFDLRRITDKPAPRPNAAKPRPPAPRPVAVDFQPLDCCRDHECSPADLQRPNPIARPEILVSRIDPRGIALRPKRTLRGIDGKGLLDARGRPQTVTFRDAAHVPRWLSVWEHDPALERRLLAEFFQRDHRYRQGAFAAAFRPAAISCGLPNGYDAALKAARCWRRPDPAACRIGPKATLLDLVEWLKQPAVLRDWRAHSDPWGSSFGKCDLSALTLAAGGQPWSWSKSGRTLTPSLHDACRSGKADFALYRTLWENHVLPAGACIYMDDGCNGISPEHAADRPYNDPEYGYWQGAQALLFSTGGLALIGRAKVFYDAPRGFYAALAAGETVGGAWRRYFELESQARSMAEVGGGIGRKRAYFWSVLGDWTVRLNPRNASKK